MRKTLTVLVPVVVALALIALAADHCVKIWLTRLERNALVRPRATADSRDSLEMQRMAWKLREYILGQLNDRNAGNAHNAALVSCVFAQEMACVAGEPPAAFSERARTGRSSPRLVAWGEYRSRVEDMILQCEQPVGDMSEEEYGSILAWALSEEDLAVLVSIRKKYQYWPSIRSVLH